MRCVWEHNGNDTLLYSVDYIGAYTRGSSHNACAFCPYQSVCHMDSVAGRRNYKAMTSQRFWEKIAKVVHSRG